MTCPHCGADVIPGYTFCQSCRKRVVPPGTSPSAPASAPAPGDFRAPAAPSYGGAGTVSLARPGAVTALAVLDLVQGLFALLAALGMFVLVSQVPAQPPAGRLILAAVGVFCLFVALVQLVAGIGLLRLANIGRILQIALAGIMLLNLPFGTVVGVLLLIYLLKPGAKVLFSGRSAQELSAQDVQDVEAFRRSTGLVIAAFAVQGLVLVAAVGIVAAIAIPSLLRARVSANESSALGDVRTMISGQVAYSMENQGYYDNADCLITPARCIPSYAGSTPNFLDPSLANPARRGYSFQLHTGPAPSPANPGASPSSVTTYAYVAVPTVPMRTGIRAFCGDASGVICVFSDGNVPPIEGGMCPPGCPPMY
jgi:hypothetical protein